MHPLGVNNDTKYDNNTVMSSSIMSWPHSPRLDSNAFLEGKITLCYKGTGYFLLPALYVYNFMFSVSIRVRNV